MPLLSVVIPAFNERARLPRFLEELSTALLASSGPSIELIVSDDGSESSHAEAYAAAVEAAQHRLAQGPANHRIKLVRSPQNQGKAAAIRLGWQHADPEARWLGFLDADGAVSAPEFLRLAQLLAQTPADAVLGSRVKLAGRQIERSLFRHLQGRVFASFVEWLFHLGLYDPQCGVKFFRASLLRPVLGQLQERGWLLDVEVLVLIHAAGGRLQEEPIDWSGLGESKVRFGIDPARMFAGLVQLQRRLAAGSPGKP